jgi:cell wall assembly regulator SMI1
MIDIWKEIEQQLKAIAPDIFSGLNLGVTDDQVTKLENIIKTKLPDDFVEFYKVHNGQERNSAGFIDCEEFLSFDRIGDEWKIWKDLLDTKTFEDDDEPYTSTPDKGIKNDWWNDHWIPITYDGSGNHYCLDLDPTEEGKYGQIIRMWHDDDERSLVANSFKEWMTSYKDQLVSGQMVYSEKYFGIIDKNEG